MRQNISPKTILITGATGAIGQALAEQYASVGVTLILFGRDELKLKPVITRCQELGARVVTCICNLLDRPGFMSLLEKICEQEDPDLVIANAGISSTADKNGEVWQAIEDVIQLNLLGTMATVQAVVPSMRKHGRGQIALISSLAAWYGLPITPAYSASKAAIKNYGEALHSSLAADGIKVCVVMPGFVESAMSRTVPGVKPFLLTAEQAAGRIRHGLATGRPRISFPFPLNLGCWFLSLLPPALSGRLIRRFGYYA